MAKKRTNFMRMMRDCDKGKIDLILTKSVARFARNTVDSLNYVRKLKAKGIGVYFEEQALDSLKTENEMAIGLYSVLAQAESENISANVRWGIQQRMKSGTFKFRYNLLGYRKGENGEPEIVEEEARYIRDIFNMYLNGCSLDQIKDYLESEGVSTKTGKSVWSKSLLKNILSNERYCGDAENIYGELYYKEGKEKSWGNAKVSREKQSSCYCYAKHIQNGADGNGTSW